MLTTIATAIPIMTVLVAPAAKAPTPPSAEVRTHLLAQAPAGWRGGPPPGGWRGTPPPPPAPPAALDPFGRGRRGTTNCGTDRTSGWAVISSARAARGSGTPATGTGRGINTSGSEAGGS